MYCQRTTKREELGKKNKENLSIKDLRYHDFTWKPFSFKSSIDVRNIVYFPNIQVSVPLI